MAGRGVPMIDEMAGRTHFNVAAVIVGVFVDQIGSFALGAIVAVWARSLNEAFSHGVFRDLDVLTFARHVYEFGCLALGAIGAYTAAQIARQSMVAHGLAVGVASLCVSIVLGFGMAQVMFDARGIVFAVLAVLAAVFGGWLASLMPMRRREPEHAEPTGRRAGFPTRA
jgi:hypothetical protein